MKIPRRAVSYIPLDEVPGYEPDPELLEILTGAKPGQAISVNKSDLEGVTRSIIHGHIGQIHKNTSMHVKLIDTKSAWVFVVTARTSNSNAGKVAVKATHKPVNTSKFHLVTSLPLQYQKTVERFIAKKGGVRIPRRLFRSKGAKGSFVSSMRQLGYEVTGTQRNSKHVVITGRRGGVKFTPRTMKSTARVGRPPLVRQTEAHVHTPAAPAVEATAPATESTLTTASTEAAPALQLS